MPKQDEKVTKNPKKATDLEAHTIRDQYQELVGQSSVQRRLFTTKGLISSQEIASTPFRFSFRFYKNSSFEMTITTNLDTVPDASVDGPVIGTLVAVIDKGKNLPNRRTLGKQNPYFVARLGKEIKRTRVDIRGGQTPRW